MIFDAHCDTMSRILDEGKQLLSNDLEIDLRRMPENYIQVFAAFVDKENCEKTPLNRCLNIIERYHSEIEKNSGVIRHCTTYDEIVQAISAGKRAAILSVEGGEALDGNLSALWALYRLGVRLMTLTWNYPNEIADGALTESKGGLTPFGKTVVTEMNRLGMVIDVSHLSERGFWDVMELTSAPIVASHSNARALCGHLRNLTDEQIRAVIQNRGAIGLNFYPEFLTDSGQADIDDILRHLEHMLALGGEECVGFGSDFDGVDCLPHGIGGIEDMPKLVERLLQAGYSEDLVKKIAAENFLRVFHEIL